ncbi:transport and Golgi organization protein 1 homolog isoform X4 [Mesoplodon densirostris]|uniref:transport and Golgi organization protein 1 homolog isoform X4 n=1 Tax=Mesoplodon densirostris TaxID=48708 RepID=UPI0028DD3ADC|nr:transport and Golgi organization protein 1 homolog isoform X4 [Mesoplodon densirostris]
MAAAPGLLLWLLLLRPLWRVPGQPDPYTVRRFSQHKLCADDECSMLMYRGEALEDFTGPDCRFVNFKKGDPVYVYYKLAGGSPELWAGSVGRTFGYFPKDLIRVVHEYTQEELQVPTDETDFVCFDGGRDDFDNYNVEELLGFLELYDSATGDSAEFKEETSQHVEEPPEASKGSDPEPEPAEPNSEESESILSENTMELRERHEAQKSHPHVNSQTGHAQGERSSFEPFGEMLQDKLKVPESENNKTSNSSQVSSEQEKIDAYKLLKTEMTLDLKTKFGSTADALVSDDETTRLVTSLEDDFDEELDAEYYTVGKEEEESKENFDELPLLTFIGGEDTKAPANSGVEKHSTEKEQNSHEEHKVEETQTPGIKNGGKNILTTWEDTIFSDVTEGKENTGTDLQSTESKEGEEGDDALVLDGKLGKPQPAVDRIDPEKAADGLWNVEVPKTNNDKDPEVDTELHIKGKGRKVEEPKRDLVQDEVGLEDEMREGMTLRGSPQSGLLHSSPAAEKGTETLKPAFANQENDLKGEAVHITKEMLHEEKPGGQSLEGASERESVPKAAGNQRDEGKIKQESMAVAPFLGGHQPNASKESTQEVDGLVNRPKPHVLSGEHPGEELIKEWLLKPQNQTRASSPGEIGLPRKPEEEGPIPGRNISWQQGDVAATANKQAREKRGLSEEEVTADTSNEGHKPLPATQEVGKTGQADSTEGPGFHTEKPEAEDDDYSPEELLEDENAVSAKRSKEKSPEIQVKRLDVDLQVPEKAVLGAVKTDPETEENKEETSNMLENERKKETAGKGVDSLGRDPGSLMVEKEESSHVDQKARRPSEGSGFPGKKENQTPEFSEASQNKDPDSLKEDTLEEHLKTSGLAEKPGIELSKEDEEDVQKLVDAGSQGSASEDHDDDDPFPWAPHTPIQPEHSVPMEDLPIISSFFKDQQTLERFQKYFDVHKLEAMFQEMSYKLKAAQRESLPYNVEKVLDKVFRAWESHILSEAEKMLDARVMKNRDLGMKDSNMFEEAAVLDDVQDLIYFVRYKHSTVEETAPLAAAQPAEEGWGGPAEDIQPLLEENIPQENTEVLIMQIPEEPSHLDQPVTSDMGTSEVSQEPNTETAGDPGIITTEVTPIDAVDAKKQLETNAEEPSSVTPLENAVLFIYSSVFYLTKTPSPTLLLLEAPGPMEQRFLSQFLPQLVATLPDDVQPGPDFYGLPWKPVLTTTFLGVVSFAIFFWRTVLAVKNRVYQVTEQQISEKLKNIMKENAELVQKLSSYEQKIKESKKHVQETKKQNMILSDEAIRFKDKIKNLEETNEILGDTAKSLRAMLESEREQNAKNQDLISENKKSVEKLKDVISVNASEFSEVQIALNEAKLSEEKVKSECHRVQEENARLKKKKEQLQQEIKDWSKSHAELSEQIRSFEKSQKDLELALTHKDDNINALTNCITQLNQLDCESESEGQNKGGNESDELANGEVGGDRSEKVKKQIKQMMDISRTQTAISVVEEDLKLLQFKLRASMSTKCNLEDQIKKLEEDRNSLQSAKAVLEDECKTLRQKVEILNELYQQKEMALQKKLSQEEYERQEREQRLSAADEKAVSAAEEVKTYKRRIEEMEEELQKTERSFKNQIATHEKKAHDNWLKARAAERAIAEEKREAANLRHKLLELTQKMAMLQEEPVIIKPKPGRPNTQSLPRRGPLSQNGSFGPSPVSGGECSPPLTADPPARPLSATLNRREMPRSEFGSVDGPLPRPRWSSEASGKPSASDSESGAAPMMNSSSRSSSPSKVTTAAKGPPPFPGAPLLSSPVGGPLLPPIRYGPPPQLCRPFGPRPLPPPFGPGLRPPLGLREYAPGVPPGKRDLPLDPREFLPGHAPFRPLGSLGPREYFIPGTRLPPPTHGPQDYPPSSAARDSPASGSRAPGTEDGDLAAHFPGSPLMSSTSKSPGSTTTDTSSFYFREVSGPMWTAFTCFVALPG